MNSKPREALQVVLALYIRSHEVLSPRWLCYQWHSWDQNSDFCSLLPRPASSFWLSSLAFHARSSPVFTAALTDQEGNLPTLVFPRSSLQVWGEVVSSWWRCPRDQFPCRHGEVLSKGEGCTQRATDGHSPPCGCSFLDDPFFIGNTQKFVSIHFRGFLSFFSYIYIFKKYIF